jgi:hypothetical protein
MVCVRASNPRRLYVGYVIALKEGMARVSTYYLLHCPPMAQCRVCVASVGCGGDYIVEFRCNVATPEAVCIDV